jgi:hypothetical protein
MKNKIVFIALKLIKFNKFTLLIMILMFSIVKPAWSQVPDVDECDSGYDFTYTRSGCTYHFEADLPGGDPEVLAVTWYLLSGEGDEFSQECQYDEGFDVYMDVCFYGYHTMVMILDFGNDNYCKVTRTFYAICANSIICDPNPNHTTSAYYQTPRIHIAWTTLKCTGCHDGWVFAFRPIGSENCEPYVWNISYKSPTCGMNSGQTYCLTLNQNYTSCYCIKANEVITIRAEANHCCLPENKKWYYIFTPSSSGSPDPELDSPWNSPDCNLWYTECSQSELNNCNDYDDVFILNSTPPSSDPFPCLISGEDKTEKYSRYIKEKIYNSLDNSDIISSFYFNSNLFLKYPGEEAFLNLYTIEGSLLVTDYPIIKYTNSKLISLSGFDKLLSGMYLIEIKTKDQKRYISKFIKL